MPEYRVKWEIDVEAVSPIAAARLALKMQRDQESVATVFGVIGPEGENIIIDVQPSYLIRWCEIHGGWEYKEDDRIGASWVRFAGSMDRDKALTEFVRDMGTKPELVSIV